jgi:hypothetical protein
LWELSRENIDSLSAAGNRLRVTNICETAELCVFVRETWGARAFRRIETIKLSGGWRLFPELYGSLCETLRREIAVDWSNAMTLARLGRLYIRNALRNLSLIPLFPSITGLSFGETPVLVLGAGPSLDETLDTLERRFSQWLRRGENRPFKIVCVDTCLGALKDRNIIPDLAVILESQHWNLRDFIGCRGWDVPAAIDLSALPLSAQMLAGRGFLFMTPWTPLTIFERLRESGLLPASFPPLGSVGLTAVELARRVSCGKIICSGLDFSFTVDKYHARSTPGHRGGLNAQTRLRSSANAAAFDTASFAAVSKSGAPVYSNPVMQNYRNLFKQEFAGDPRLFDITGSGLPLGIKTLSLEDAMLMLTAVSKRNEKREVNLSNPAILKEKLLTFLNDEKVRLEELRDILTGRKDGHERLNALVDECDYLWAHFPDYSGGRRPGFGEITGGSQAALSFLKRLRTEIDPMLDLIKRVDPYLPYALFEKISLKTP